MATIPKPTLTSPPTPPTLQDPANFDERADEFTGWFPGAWDDLGAALDFVDQESAAAEAAKAAAQSARDAAAQSASTAQTHRNDAQAARDAAAASAASALNAPGTNATSTTSLSIGTGPRTLTIQTGKAFVVGQLVVVASTSSPSTNWMHGQITAHNSATGALTVQVGLVSGAGTLANWTIALSGPVPQAIAWAAVTGKPAFFGDATATWVFPGRVVNTIYQNTTGRALAIHIAADSGALQIGTTTASLLPWIYFDGSATGGVMMVPNGWFYRLVSVGFDSWREM